MNIFLKLIGFHVSLGKTVLSLPRFFSFPKSTVLSKDDKKVLQKAHISNFFFLSNGHRMSCNTSVTHLDVSSLKRVEQAPVHLLPCEIEHNGVAQVSQYFTATTKHLKQGTQIPFFNPLAVLLYQKYLK